MTHKHNPQPALIEASGVHDVFAAELARIEHIGPCSRLVFAVPITFPTNEQTLIERIVVARVVIPTDTLATIATKLLSGRDSPDLRHTEPVPEGLN